MSSLREKFIREGQQARKTIRLKLFGADVDVVQLNVGAVLAQAKEITADELVRFKASESAIKSARMIVSALADPGTGEQIFTEDDISEIVNWPFTKEISDLMNAIGELNNPDSALVNAKQELKESPLSEESSNTP